MSAAKREPTEAEIRAKIEREFGRWNEIAQNGCSDPHWDDGTNLRLVRAHILYWYNQLAERGFTVRDLFGGFPDERPVPPEVPYGYMVRGGENVGRVERWTQRERDEITWGCPGEYAL